MGVENFFFWSEIGSVFGDPRGTPPLRISRSTPPPRDQGASVLQTLCWSSPLDTVSFMKGHFNTVNDNHL